MQFIRGGEQDAVTAVAERLCTELAKGQRVLWLVSGGSNIPLEAEVMKRVRETCGERLASLAILPTDERYGVPGHKDSNAQQLREAGFDPGAATWIDVLTHGVPLDQTIDFYSDVASTAIANAAVVIAQFGIGTDGHIAGILPDSPAVSVDAATVLGYEAGEFTRITLSAETLRHIEAAYAVALGRSKQEALGRLEKNSEPFAKLPAKILYEMAEAYVYNDNIESKE